MWAVIAIVVVAIIVIAIVMAVRARSGMGLRKLPPESRDRYQNAWQHVEARFIDQPQTAAMEADRVVTELLRERGAKMEDHKLPKQLREARELRAQSGEGGTEGMRKAMLQYRRIIEDGVGPVAKRPRTESGRREVAS
jgi:hypothetical protein